MVQELKRRHDWRGRLSAFLDETRRDGFAWGKHDCALGLACGAVEAITGADLRKGWRGKYKTNKGALRALKKRGFDNVGDAFAAELPEYDNLLMAGVGDIAVVQSDDEFLEAMAVVDVSSLIILTSEGQGRIPRSRMVRAFKVG
ncbi:DUF6950 family protein [Celeribacter sp.]|uniref:DUF6950 family protein n=1 Tax=Celeribacter sp. TaxID=1890673 RepID=UPI003A8D30FF